MLGESRRSIARATGLSRNTVEKYVRAAVAAGVSQGAQAFPTLSIADVDKIRADIVGGALAPGEKLKLGELSDRYDCGINPLREALARLGATGLVVLEDQKGVRVAPVSREDLLDLTHVRQQVEVIRAL